MNRAYSSSRWSKRRLTPLARGWRRWRKDIRKLLSWSWTWSCGLSMNRRRGTDVTAVCLWAAGSVKVSLSCDENSVTITNLSHAVLCWTRPSRPPTTPRLPPCAFASPPTARPPCWSPPAKTDTSKPGSSLLQPTQKVQTVSSQPKKPTT